MQELRPEDIKKIIASMKEIQDRINALYASGKDFDMVDVILK